MKWPTDFFNKTTTTSLLNAVKAKRKEKIF